MIIKYYVETEKGKVLVRTSANEYKYALVDSEHIVEGRRGLYCCSGSYENIAKQYNYWKNINVENYKYWLEKGNQEKANYDLARANNLKIVELVK